MISMLRIVDGNLEIGTQVWSDIGNLICFRHLFGSRAVANLIDIWLHNTYVNIPYIFRFFKYNM